VPTVTVVSTAFAPLARVVGEGIGFPGLPMVVVAHPVGDRDEAVVKQRGEAIASECVRLLTTPASALAEELALKQYPLPAAVMPR
jgi:hypothetical protein